MKKQTELKQYCLEEYGAIQVYRELKPVNGQVTVLCIMPDGRNIKGSGRDINEAKEYSSLHALTLFKNK